MGNLELAKAHRSALMERDQLQAENKQLRADLEEALEALRPFAEVFDPTEPPWLSQINADLRRAQAVLEKHAARKAATP